MHNWQIYGKITAKLYGCRTCSQVQSKAFWVEFLCWTGSCSVWMGLRSGSRCLCAFQAWICCSSLASAFEIIITGPSGSFQFLGFSSKFEVDPERLRQRCLIEPDRYGFLGADADTDKKARYRYICWYYLCVYYSSNIMNVYYGTVPVKCLDTLSFWCGWVLYIEYSL